MENKFTAGVLTISDKGSQGLREDSSGAAAAEMLERAGFSVPFKKIVPDDREQIAGALVEWADRGGIHLIVTSGGTGLSPSDVPPQAMEEVIDFQVPAMAEAMRAASLAKTVHAFLETLRLWWMMQTGGRRVRRQVAR